MNDPAQCRLWSIPGDGVLARQVTVLFDEHGYRELYLPAVLGRGLLRPA